MKKENRNCLVIVLFFLLQLAMGITVSAQTSEQQKLGIQYFEKAEYDKSKEIFEKLFSKNPDEINYSYYVNSLLELKEYKIAEKTIRKLLKKQGYSSQLQVDLGSVFLKSGDEKTAFQEFEKAIDKLSPNQSDVIQLAGIFQQKNLIDFTIKTYLKGQSMLRGIYPFYFELAEAYNGKGDIANMIDQYLESINFNSIYLVQVQNALQTNLGEENNTENKKLLRQLLLKKIQANPDKVEFTEMLVWLFVQDKNFESAFDQQKALDKRLKNQSVKMVNLAQLANSNEDYSAATKIYDYEIAKGKDNPYFYLCRQELVNVLYAKITKSANYTSMELEQLKFAYLNLIEEQGKNSSTLNLMKGLGHLYAFYLDDINKAMEILNEAINIPGGDAKLKAECKLELGDVLIFSGDVWEASLLYSQVEKLYKQDVLGQEAKFKNAKLSYYKGDFYWAQGQLSVLKAATSKLIANDALELSLLITENFGIDSLLEPMQMFSRADLLEYQNKDSLAILALDSILKAYPFHSLNDDILFKKYKIRFKQKRYLESEELLSLIVTKYNDDILADDANFYLGELYQYKLNDLEKAKKYYSELIEKFPGSSFTVEARKRFRKLRGDNL